MPVWFTRRGAPIEEGWTKRFAASDWTVDFPRGAMAAVVTDSGGRGLSVEAQFLRRGDLVGLIFESEDRHSHPAWARRTSRDYSHCRLSFRLRTHGIIPLDAFNGPTLTIEGRDAEGQFRGWYVRLWNYANGSPTDATVTLDFDELAGGFLHPGEADPVYPRDIDRMFISMASPGFVPGSSELMASPVSGRMEMSAIACEGSGSVISRGDAWSPEHGFGACTSYDDMYHLSPERVVAATEAAGFRGAINHYVGMSHYPTLGPDGLVDPGAGLNGPALAWHRGLARAAKEHGFELIWSLSYELLAMFCPEAWKQRAHDGEAAATGYDPPSSLFSPANGEAMAYLGRIAAELVGLSVEAGLQPQFQVGEPWWWVRADGAICCYDAAARAALGGNPAVIADIRGSLSAAQKLLLDQAGVLLASATAGIFAAARVAAPATKTHLLAYLPGPLDPHAPEAVRANLPVGWAKPAFDVLQLEDYEWVTGGRHSLREAAYQLAEGRLGYPIGDQHYFSGFVATAGEREQWRRIVSAAREARDRGVARTFIWAMPQWWRDGVTLLGEEDEVTPFDDVDFPISIGSDASVTPGFSTNVVTSAGGHEHRNANWSQARLRFDAGPGVRSEAELGELIAFFRARRGPAVAFRFRDPFDHSSNGMTGLPTAADQPLGEGDGAKTEFRLVKHYGGSEVRRITRPVAGSVRLSVNGSEVAGGWNLDPLGIVQFDAAPAAGAVIAAGFVFDTPVRFADDQLSINRSTFLAGEAPSVPLIEVREA
jgi:uncharacterized protein (TIGR02217 family)